MTHAEQTVPSSTGDVGVDRILASLDALSTTAVSDHAALYLDVLDRLGRELTSEQAVRGAGAHGAP